MRNCLDAWRTTAKTLLACLVLCSLTWVGIAQTLHEYRRQVGRLIQDYKWGEAFELVTAALVQHPEDPQLLVAAAALMLQMGEPENGEKLIEAAVSTTVEDPDLLCVMAELKLSRGRMMGAAYLYRRALVYAPESSRLHYRLSRLLFASGDVEEALEHAGKAVELDEKGTDYRRFYALILEQAGQPEQAYEQLRLARLGSPGDARLLLRLGDTARRNGHPNQALEYLDMAAALDPENPLYQQELARVFSALGASEQAEAARYLASRLEGAFQTYAKAVALVSRGENNRAATVLKSVVDENPEFMTGAVLLADLYTRLGENQKAISVYQGVLARDPSRARVKEETAWLYVEKGELDIALEILKDTDPQDVNHVLLEGYQKLVEADWEGAMTEFKKAEMRYPLDPRILQQISLCLNSMGRTHEALAYLEKAHAVQPQNSTIDRTARLVRFDYGLGLEKEGRWREALAVFRELRDEDHEQADYFFHEAYCQQNLWQYKQAIELYTAGLRIEQQAAWVRINLATCLYALSLFDEAAEQWELLVKDSDNPEYLYNLGLARIRQWRLKEGWKLIGRAADAGFTPARRLQREGKR